MTVRYGSSDSESTVVGLLQDLKIQYHLGCGVIGVDRGNLEDCRTVYDKIAQQVRTS